MVGVVVEVGVVVGVEGVVEVGVVVGVEVGVVVEGGVEGVNTRRKGQRTFGKAMRYAKSLYPKAVLLPIYQVSRWAQPQPFDLLIFEFDTWPICVEVRTNQWGVSKPQTKVLAQLPGLVHKEIWMFKRGEHVPTIRRWRGNAWESSGGGESSIQGRGETGIVSPAASASFGGR